MIDKKKAQQLGAFVFALLVLFGLPLGAIFIPKAGKIMAVCLGVITLVWVAWLAWLMSLLFIDRLYHD